MMQWHPFAGGGVSCAVGGGFGCGFSEVGLRNSPGDAGGARSADFGVSGPGDSTSIGTADSKSAAWSAAASSKLSSVRDGAWISENVRAEPHSAAAVVGRPCVPDNVNGSPATEVTGRRIISGDEGADAATGTPDTLPPDDVGGRTRTAPAGSDLRLSRCSRCSAAAGIKLPSSSTVGIAEGTSLGFGCNGCGEGWPLDRT